ncbi:hypothetical protein [Sutcliffiella sp. NC1]|uniref:hypothetical protein n=1 Tax=Sutcliffiella sp. NC1 TaxID=3004096 RepID=UPI0022DD0FCC|nr:hypothetical protein [Sutcliffiella sp. NC1]WBL16347.1 hypothetical protein O1A01_06865 [Sutcliffiella sp. NC1]
MTTIEKNIHSFAQVNSRLDNSLQSCEERNELVKDLLIAYKDDEGLYRYIDEIDTMINSKQYKIQHAKENKKSFLSEHDPFCMKLDALADYILTPENGKVHNEHSWLSKYAKEQNANREVYINYQDDDWNYGNGISEEALDIARFNQEQKNYLNKRFSEEAKRKNRRITSKDLQNYPELISMQSTVFLLQNDLWIGTDAEGVVRREYIMQFDKYIDEMKREAFSKWMNGQPRIDLFNYYDNPLKKEVVKLESVSVPIVNGDVLEKKFAKLLHFYGIPSSGKVAYKKLRKIINEVNYEMYIVKEQLRKPVRNGGYKPRVANPNFIPNPQFQHITLSDPSHVFALFKFDTDTIKVNDGDGKQKRFKNYIPLYLLLKDTYGNWAGNHVCDLLKQFEEALKAVKLDSVQRDIVEVVLQNKAVTEGYDKHPYRRAAEYVNDEHGIALENRDVKRKLEQISKSVAGVIKMNKI